MSTRKRVILLSIDGVPYSMLSRFLEAGHLPNFARLAQKAPLRQMDSVHPTVSSVAWTSYITGKQPGKHGVYGFIDRKPGTYEMSIPSSASITSKTIWEILSDHGLRVFGMNVPLTYPPPQVNGILIGGFLCPTVEKVAYPAQLSDYLKSIDYQIDSDPMLARESKERMLPNLHQTLDARMEAMFHFLAQEPWDYFHTHIMATDRINHFLIEKYEQNSQKFAQEFVKFYQKIDSYLGKLMDTLDSDCSLVVMSDHGFCPIINEVQLSRYLIEKGWTVPADPPQPSPLAIDPAKSRAYNLIPGRIFVNLKGREPAGIVAPEEFEQVRDELTKDLLSLRAPNGDQVIKQVFKREELYWDADSHQLDPKMPLDKLLSSQTSFGKAADLIAIPFDGYDLKMGLAAPQTFVKTQLEGMHTYHDATIMAQGVELPKERFSIINVASCVFRALGLEPPADLDYL